MTRLELPRLAALDARRRSRACCHPVRHRGCPFISTMPASKSPAAPRLRRSLPMERSQPQRRCSPLPQPNAAAHQALARPASPRRDACVQGDRTDKSAHRATTPLAQYHRPYPGVDRPCRAHDRPHRLAHHPGEGRRPRPARRSMRSSRSIRAIRRSSTSTPRRTICAFVQRLAAHPRARALHGVRRSAQPGPGADRIAIRRGSHPAAHRPRGPPQQRPRNRTAPARHPPAAHRQGFRGTRGRGADLEHPRRNRAHGSRAEGARASRRLRHRASCNSPKSTRRSSTRLPPPSARACTMPSLPAWTTPVTPCSGSLLFFEEYGPVLLVWFAVLATPVWLLWRRYRRAKQISGHNRVSSRHRNDKRRAHTRIVLMSNAVGVEECARQPAPHEVCPPASLPRETPSQLAPAPHRRPA